MRLTELEPQFLKRESDRSFRHVNNIDAADGISFICPKCFDGNGRKREGVHSVICWDPSVPQTTSPKPGRWRLVGTDYEDLSLVAGSSSVLLNGGCAAHFFVENGLIRMA